MPSNNYIYKMSNAGGMSTVTRYTDMLAGNAAFVDSSYESIATTTVGAGGVSSITFSSIPATYQHLQIRAIYQDTSASGFQNQFFRFNGDSATNYDWHYIFGDGASVTVNASLSASSIFGGQIVNSNNSNFGTSIIDILDYKDTNKYKVTRGLYGNDQNGSGRMQMVSGLWRSTSAISSIVFTTSANFAQYSSFALYGIKG
jgi:hypothetical protein